MRSITKLSVLLVIIGIIDTTVAQRPRPRPRPRPTPPPISYCTSCCSDGWTEWNNHCYKYFTSSATGDAAESACVGHGGHLASINDYEEQKFVFNLWQRGGLGPNVPTRSPLSQYIRKPTIISFFLSSLVVSKITTFEVIPKRSRIKESPSHRKSRPLVVFSSFA